MLQEDDIIKVDDIIKISPHDTLAAGLSKLTTSHDAAFVFNEENKFLGVVNPYYCLIRSSYPGNAKVEHCLFHPPHLKTRHPLPKILQLLIESKIHYLPVFDDKERLVGITSARRILCRYENATIFQTPISEFLKHKNNNLITITEDESVNAAVHLFKKTKTSKLVVLGKDMKLKGILSYYDLIAYLMSPKDGMHRGERMGVKTNFYNLKVKNFYKTYVLTLKAHNVLKDALRLILGKRIGSVVVVDAERHPTGIITTRDLLRVIGRSYQKNTIQLISSNLSRRSRQIVGGFFNTLCRSFKNNREMKSARLLVKEEKNGGLFRVAFSFLPKKGKLTVKKREGRSLIKILKNIKGD
ncbi:CBS domain-containing protein [Candidatus Roizmanbacteria bacterium]|nr:CBS domain-containing protein [Candidatus Roizmanbacteria bacterium]